MRARRRSSWFLREPSSTRLCMVVLTRVRRGRRKGRGRAYFLSKEGRAGEHQDGVPSLRRAFGPPPGRRRAEPARFSKKESPPRRRTGIPTYSGFPLPEAGDDPVPARSDRRRGSAMSYRRHKVRPRTRPYPAPIEILETEAHRSITYLIKLAGEEKSTVIPRQVRSDRSVLPDRARRSPQARHRRQVPLPQAGLEDPLLRRQVLRRGRGRSCLPTRP